MNPTEARDRRGAGPRAPALLKVGVFLSFVGVIVLEPSLPSNTAFIDPVLLLVTVFGLGTMLKYRSEAVTGLGKAMPWLWLFLLGSLLGLSHVGFPDWAFQSLGRTLFALLTFFCFWHLIDVYRLERLAMKGVLVAAVTAAAVLVVPGYDWRSDGWFPNPNYAGHFGVASGFVLFLAARTRWVRAVGLICIAVSIQASGSFGSIGMTVTMGAVLLLRMMQRHTAILLGVLLAAAVVAAMFLSAPEPEVDDAGLSDREVTSAISTNRLDRTSTGRGEIWGHAIDAWEKEPFGIGPNGYRHREVFISRGRPLEVHSDPIGILAERGVIGLIGWIGLWVSIWKMARPGGLARVLIVGHLVQAMFREVLHYRHAWLLLALLLVIDHRAEQGSTTDEEDTDDALRVGERPGGLSGRPVGIQPAGA